MHKNYIQVAIGNISAEQAAILVAQLSEAGFDGFEEGDDFLHAFIEEEQLDETVLQTVLASGNLTATQTVIPQTNWNEVWEKNFNPVVVDDFAAVRAHFHAPISNVAHEIIITPKMSFGTGHHATTFMMMQQMRTLDFLGKTVFDFGTGTGILAILAAKLGAAEIAAIDNDAWSIENAAENFARNNCDTIHLQLAAAPPVEEQFDIVLANINKHIILENINLLAAMLKANGQLLVSGLLKEDEVDILKAVNDLHLKHIQTYSRDKWICIHIMH